MDVMEETREIIHKLGKVAYRYNSDSAWTETDQELADHLAQKILTVEGHLDQAEEMGKRATKISKWIADRTVKFEETAAALKDAQDVASGYVGALELGQFSIAEELSKAVNKANGAIQEQNAAARKYHKQYEQLIADHNELQDKHEQELDELARQYYPLFKKAAEMDELATDIESYDMAEEQSKAVFSVNGQRIASLLSYCLDVIHQYDMLLAKIEGQQNVWSEFCSRMVLIEYIGKLRSGSAGISFN